MTESDGLLMLIGGGTTTPLDFTGPPGLLIGGGAGALVMVGGQMVVEVMVSVVLEPYGQLVTEAGHLVMVYSVVV